MQGHNSKGETLNLKKNVLITSSNGYQGRLKEANVNVKTGHVVSDKPVEMKMLQGTLNSNRMEIINSGELIRFDGGVTMVMTLNKSELKPKAAADGAGARAATTAADKDIVWLRLPPRDPRRIRRLTTGSIR